MSPQPPQQPKRSDWLQTAAWAIGTVGLLLLVPLAATTNLGLPKQGATLLGLAAALVVLLVVMRRLRRNNRNKRR